MPEPAVLAAAETALPTDPTTGRPVWKGLPVPWVTRWSGEAVISADRALVLVRHGGALHAAYSQPDPYRHPLGVMAGFDAQRDELGLLWYRDELDVQGVGEPFFAQLQAVRQRACIMDRRCQVCGRGFPPGEPVTFLEGVEMFARGGAFDTSNAPVCRSCAPVAMRACPYQRASPRQLVTAHAYRPNMVIGDVYTADAAKNPKQMCIALGDPRIRHMLVKQLCVRITEYDAEPIGES